MFSKTKKVKKSFIGAIAMSLILLMGSAFGFLIEANLTNISTGQSGLWTSYTSAVTVGNGSVENPYKVKSGEELSWVAQNGDYAYVELDSDIDLAAHNWIPIANGKIQSLDGNGHTINNLKIDLPNQSIVGFFELFDPIVGIDNTQIRDIIFSNVDIHGGSYVGTVAGQCHIDAYNVVVKSGIVVATQHYAGGIVCFAGGGSTIVNCVNNASIYANSSAAGIVSQRENNGRIENCINTGDISGGLSVGGIVGSLSCSPGHFVTIKNCYAECKMTSAGCVGGIIGMYGSSSLAEGQVIENCGFNGEIIITADNGEYIGSIVGGNRSSYKVNIKNSFGVAKIVLKNGMSSSVVNKFGAPESFNFESTYSHSYIYNTGSNSVELRKYKTSASETEPFKDMAYYEGINGGYPFPRSLFSIGQFLSGNAFQYLQGFGFSND